MDFLDRLLDGLPLIAKLLVVFGIVFSVHLVIMFIRKIAKRIRVGKDIRNRKLRSVISLGASFLTFTLYFLVLGFILKELGISLTAYLASASVVGLAVGFGSQGVVQDVVTGLTIVFTDLIDVDDLVEISGQTGIVKGITMRFVELENALGGRVFIPNRTISNVINYPKGYIRCIVDITLIGEIEVKDKIVRTATEHMQSFYEQFPGILLTRPSIEGRLTSSNLKEYLRIKFRIWPNRGQPIEQTYCKELTQSLQQINDQYEDWMIAVYYEVEQKDGYISQETQSASSK